MSNNSEQPSNIEVSSTAKPLLGEILLAQREQKKLMVHEVAGQLRLSIRQINALEANDFSQLPEPMITRGFIRNYARFLGIDAEPLMQAHRALSGEDQPLALSISSENISIAHTRAIPWFKFAVMSLLGLLIFFALTYYALHPFSLLSGFSAKSSDVIASNPASTQKKTEESTPVATEKMPEPALPIAERLAEDEASPATAQVAADETVTAVKTTPSVPESENKDVQNTQVLPIGAQLEFELSFTEQSWVRVVDGDNKEIFSKLNAAGSSEKIAGKPPLKLHIGNATGTKVVYKNSAVDLGQYTKNNVARLTLSLEKN